MVACLPKCVGVIHHEVHVADVSADDKEHVLVVDVHASLTDEVALGEEHVQLVVHVRQDSCAYNAASARAEPGPQGVGFGSVRLHRVSDKRVELEGAESVLVRQGRHHVLNNAQEQEFVDTKHGIGGTVCASVKKARAHGKIVHVRKHRGVV